MKWSRVGALWRSDRSKADLTGYIDLGVLGRVRVQVYKNTDENKPDRAPDYHIVLPPEVEAQSRQPSGGQANDELDF